MAKHKTIIEECDVLVVGGGMAGTGATFGITNSDTVFVL